MTTKKATISVNTSVSSSSSSSESDQQQQQQLRHKITEMIKISPSHGALESNGAARHRDCWRTLTSIAAPAKQRSHFSTKSISIACISYIILNQLFTTVLISSSGLVSSKHNPNITYKLSGIERSIVGLVAASPAPAPSPARSATSQRVPPMNGSIFGKRDLVSASRDQHASPERGGQARPTSTAVDYNEIITNVIEDFMARNNEVDPQETTVAFCRMIVYECHQVLANHSRRKKAPSQRNKLSAATANLNKRTSS